MATAAVAMSGPTPGISISRLQVSLCRATLLSCFSRPSISESSSLNLLYWSSSTVMRYGGSFAFIRSRAAGSSLSSAARPLWMVSPNSRSVPCRALICAVLNFTSYLRERCRTSTDCCSSVLTAISLPGCCTAIQIARAAGHNANTDRTHVVLSSARLYKQLLSLYTGQTFRNIFSLFGTRTSISPDISTPNSRIEGRCPHPATGPTLSATIIRSQPSGAPPPPAYLL